MVSIFLIDFESLKFSLAISLFLVMSIWACFSFRIFGDNKSDSGERRPVSSLE